MEYDLKQPFLPMSAIVVVDNPRTYFDPTEMEELESSIRSNGVLQPVGVRSLGIGDNGFETFALVWGERRFRASKAVFGEGGNIDVKLTHAGASEAQELALIENTVRADMSATEEAEAAHREMVKYNNDKAEVLRRLGWKSFKLEQRLALMRCAPEVRVALNERKIMLGHAELLAVVPMEKQVSSLQKIIDNKLSVAYVKQNLARVAQSLVNAAFDQTECLTCPHNTASQCGLFAETLDSGFCTNSPCYDRKTMAALDIIKEELVQEYPTVKIIALGDAITTIPIIAIGQMAVGETQAKACRACENFGCTISALPESTGKVERGVCFDAACNATKVAANLRATKASTVAATPAASSASKGKGTAKGGAKPAKSGAPKPASVQTPTKVKEYRVGLWRTIAKQELMQRPGDAITVLVVLGVIGSAGRINSSRMGDAFKKLVGCDTAPNSTGMAEALASVDANPAAKAKLLEVLSASAMADIEERQLVATLTFLKADMTAHWSLCEEFLKLLTKSEIEVIAEELGLKQAMGEKFAKASGDKKDAFIKALLGIATFDYASAIPAVLRYGHKDVAAQPQDNEDNDNDNDPDSDDNPVEPELSESDDELAETA